ncbi:PQQ-dependent sugar dehydrogenase [Halobacteria archaeon AArc-dxtr1]|nr:PQQ-dependent sugar dehydrogenase [Halobacteria archaeon AArc-dxtr1]
MTEHEGSENDRATGKRNRLLCRVGGLGAIGLSGCLDGTDGPASDTGDDGGNGDENGNGEETGGNGEKTNGVEETWHRDHDPAWGEPDPDAATDWDNYEITELLAVDNLMSIDISPDGRVWYITRGAPFVTLEHGTSEIGWIDPDTGNHEIAIELDVQVGALEEPDEHVEARELGGQAIALDPDFEDNGYVYVYYTPPADERDDVQSPYAEWYDGEVDFGYMVVSQFETLNDRIDPTSEVELLRIHEQHDYCCHRGGNLQFGPEGHLYVTTGDDANAIGSTWGPLDDSETAHPNFDGRRTSGNTADLRGKVLRIVPENDGYSIPEGNLKEAWESETGDSYTEAEFRPEIYAMGFRNPFIISVDEHTASIFVGDYAPGGGWDTDIGPVGLATWHAICEPANAGWPFFKGYYPYRRWDFESDQPGQPYWPDNLRNDSQNNTGIEDIPNVTPATVWQAQDWDSYVEAAPWVDMPQPGEVTWPGVSELGSANAGPAYRYSEAFSEGALDPHFEGKQFLMAPFAPDSWVGYLTYEEDGTVEVNEFLPDHPWQDPTEMKYGPQGRLFMMDYSDIGNGGIHMIEYYE